MKRWNCLARLTENMKIALLADGSMDRFVFDKAVDDLPEAERQLALCRDGLSSSKSSPEK
jgi:hypothetical protein